MLTITPEIRIDEQELEERFIRASGPGGQHVNKVATAVQLRFQVERSPSLPEAVKERLKRLVGHRMTLEGDIIIQADRFRSQEHNRQDARRRLAAVILSAATPPTPRRKTRLPEAARRRRLEHKRLRGTLKQLRRTPPTAGDGT